MNKKYEFTGETMKWRGRTLQRIRALVDIANVVKAGELGGMIESEDNLSHKGASWICGYAMVYDNAVVYDNAKVYGRARIHGEAKIGGTAEVYGKADVGENAILRDGKIESAASYLCVGPIGSRRGYTTLNLTTCTVCTGCFVGSIDEFEKAVKRTHGDNEYGRAYRNVIALFRAMIGGYQLCDDSPSKVDVMLEVTPLMQLFACMERELKKLNNKK